MTMKKLNYFILNHINLVSIILSFLVTITYCFCSGEICKKYTISYSITTGSNGPIELKSYYTLFTNKDFNETNTQSIVISNKANKQYDGTYYVYIPYNESIFLWRFDLGNKTDNIIINKLLINGRTIDNNSIDLQNLVFSSDLELKDYKEGSFRFVSKGKDPFFIINQEFPCKTFYSIRNMDIVTILILLSFFVIRDLLFQLKKFKKTKNVSD